MAGRFITFEGGEGAGKSTQIKRLSDWLNEKGIAHITTREPGGSEGAEAIRELIVTGDADRWDPMSEAMLIMTARVNHMQQTILPALTSGEWVLCDRFFDSTRVYQGISKGIGLPWLNQLYALCFGNHKPDLTVLFDIDPEVGLKRAISRNGNETRFEELPLEFHQTLRAGFLKLAKDEPTRFATLDASQPMEDVFASLQSTISERLGL